MVAKLMTDDPTTFSYAFLLSTCLDPPLKGGETWVFCCLLLLHVLLDLPLFDVLLTHALSDRGSRNLAFLQPFVLKLLEFLVLNLVLYLGKQFAAPFDNDPKELAPFYLL